MIDLDHCDVCGGRATDAVSCVKDVTRETDTARRYEILEPAHVRCSAHPVAEPCPDHAEAVVWTPEQKALKQRCSERLDEYLRERGIR